MKQAKNVNWVTGKSTCYPSIYSLIPLEDFKAVMGIDDREDSLARFCLTIATHTIEQHCMRRLIRKRHFERLEYMGDLLLPLKEYPVTEVLAVYLYNREQVTGKNKKRN